MSTPILFIGEAYGEQEARFESPFVGSAGQELARMLNQAGYPCNPLPYSFNSAVRMLHYWKGFPYPILNVFNQRPPENDVSFFYAKPKDNVAVDRTYASRRFDNSLHYLKAEFSHHLITLHEAIAQLQPQVIVALGNTALWALGIQPAIAKLRGTLIPTRFGLVLPTYHPAAILRKWDYRTIAVLDLYKALRQSKLSAPATPAREIWTEPTIADLWAWWEQYGSKASLLGFDIETIKQAQISEVGFAADSTHALHIPFFYKSAGQFINWWPDARTELKAWEFVKTACESDIPKIGQNVVQYDTYWMIKAMNIQVRNIAHDTMTMAHAWQPELEKSLGFLGSIFLDERAWKSIRTDTTKQND